MNNGDMLSDEATFNNEVNDSQMNDNQTSEASTNTVGVGVDLVDIKRMSDVLERTPKFATRNFSAQEQSYCDSKIKPAAHYAGFFAAKEAVLKALGVGFIGTRATDVEVDHDKKGRPLVLLHGAAKNIADKMDVDEIYLSISRTHDVSVASAVLSTKKTRPMKDIPEEDSKTKLMRKYRELRTLLDELEPSLEIPNSDDKKKDA